jgi:hypothetical protein
MSFPYKIWTIIAPFVCILISSSNALLHHLKINGDDRDVFKIETFGFVEGGIMNMTVTDFTMSKPPKGEKSGPAGPRRVGFIMRKAPSESAAQQDLEKVRSLSYSSHIPSFKGRKSRRFFVSNIVLVTNCD